MQDSIPPSVHSAHSAHSVHSRIDSHRDDTSGLEDEDEDEGQEKAQHPSASSTFDLCVMLH